MKKVSQHLSQAGFSLVQVMVGTALMAGLALMVFNLMETGKKAQVSLTQNGEFEILKSNVDQLVNSSACSTAFRKSDGTPATFGRTDNANPSSPLLPTTLAELRKVIGTREVSVVKLGEEVGALTVTGINLVYQKDINNVDIPPEVDTPTAGKTTHHVELQLIVSRGKKGMGGKDLSSSRVPRLFSIITDNATSLITGCANVSTSSSNCKMLKGVAQTANNSIDPVTFTEPFTTIPIVMATPRVGAPVGITNITKTGFDAVGQVYDSHYYYTWIAYDTTCFTSP